MRALDPSVQAALEAGTLVPRDFLWITARIRETGAPFEYGVWSDLGSVTAPVLEPSTGAQVNRVYRGMGALVEVSPVVLVSGLTVQTVSISLNHLDPEIISLLQAYDLRRAAVELHRGFLDPVSMRLVAPAVPRFSGFVDEAPLTTPAEGGEGIIELICASHTQDLTRSSSAKRSDADQRRRSATDGFFRHAATVGQWTITWGQAEE
jgi:hypothetical protein